jgi:hypothetical protein
MRTGGRRSGQAGLTKQEKPRQIIAKLSSSRILLERALPITERGIGFWRCRPRGGRDVGGKGIPNVIAHGDAPGDVHPPEEVRACELEMRVHVDLG